MGNRALRKEAARLIKERGLPVKLYRGKQGKFRYSAPALKSLIYSLKYKVGDVVGDCDGSNHIIKKIVWYKSTNNRWWGHGQRGYALYLKHHIFEDGTYSCGCSGSPEDPRSREVIEKAWTDLDQSEQDELEVDSREWKIFCWIKAGGHVYDENGIMLPAWRKTYA
ncbi:MAG: hypothetical protein WC761_02325 [Candidatus Paceibacterota bacterium]